MNKVLLTGRLTRDPEMRSLASGKNVTTVSVPVSATPRSAGVGCLEPRPGARLPAHVANATGAASAHAVRSPRALLCKAANAV